MARMRHSVPKRRSDRKSPRRIDADASNKFFKKKGQLGEGLLGQRIADLGSAPPCYHHPSLSQRSQMARDGGLADLEEIGEVTRAGLGLEAQVADDAQPYRVSQRAKQAGLPARVLSHTVTVTHSIGYLLYSLEAV